MSEIYTTERIRELFTDGGFWPGDDFDRWLKQIKAEAWAEGFDAGERDVWEHQHKEDGWDADCIPNPYLEGEK